MAEKAPTPDPAPEPPTAAWVVWDQRIAAARLAALTIIEDALAGKGDDAGERLRIASLALDTLKKLTGG